MQRKAPRAKARDDQLILPRIKIIVQHPSPWMGVHLVFFLHVTSGPDSANNVLALAFGNRNHNMLPMEQIMNMQR